MESDIKRGTMGSKKLFEINLLDQLIVYEQIYQNDSEGFII